MLVGIGLLLPQNKFSSELCWAYYPTKDVIFYRCTVISNFSEELTPNPQQYWSVLCEIGQDPEEVIEDESKIIEKTIEG